MPTLVLLRHGKSGYPPGVDDHDRPLSPRGEREAPLAGRAITVSLAETSRAAVATIDLALVSTAVRAQQTWNLAAEHLPSVSRLVVDPNMYLAPAHDLLEIVRGLANAEQCVLFVGHNDGLELLASTLADEDVRLKTSAFAVLSSPLAWERWAPGAADLVDVVVAR